MSTPNRSALINAAYKVLKEHYQPCQPPADRSLFEILMYACCLEDARPEAADEAFARLQQTFFDWNEVRVTTVAELAETLAPLPDATAAAKRLRPALQHIFETHYAFDLEPLKKQNLGKAVKEIEAIRGVTPFVTDYVTQHGLGGHAIPLSKSIIDVLTVMGVITEVEAKRNRVPGLERAIPKAKGIEFASLLHQLAAEFLLSPHSTKLRALLLQIDPQAKQRLAQRLAKPDETPAAAGENAAPPPPATDSAAPAKGATAGRRKRKEAPSAAGPSAQDAATCEEGDAAAIPKTSATKQLSKKKPR